MGGNGKECQIKTCQFWYVSVIILVIGAESFIFTELSANPKATNFRNKNIKTITSHLEKASNYPTLKQQNFPSEETINLNFKMNDVVTPFLRSQYFSSEFARILDNKKQALMSTNPQILKQLDVLAKQFLKLLCDFIVFAADTVFRCLDTLPAKIQKEKVTCDQLYKELCFAALEQMLPIVTYLDFYKEFTKQLNNNEYFDTLQNALRKTTYISQIKNNSEEIQIDFSDQHAQLIFSTLNSTVKCYEELYLKKNNYAILLSSEIATYDSNLRQKFKTLQLMDALNASIDILADFIVVESNKIAEKSSHDIGTLYTSDIYKIYTDVISIALQHLLPIIAYSVSLTSFIYRISPYSNHPEINQQSPKKIHQQLRKTFKNEAPYILNQQRKISEEKYIDLQICPIMNILYEMVLNHVRIFHKETVLEKIKK
jgi:hypothetical protein